MPRKSIKEAIIKVGEIFNKETFDEAIPKDAVLTVTVSLKGTVNMGNYESMGYGLGASIQAKPEYAEQVRQELTEYVEKILAQKVEEYRKMSSAI